ncbi:MAG: hypothetical protein ACRD0J_11730 [Acidimicrobiales bacterium]
MKLRMSHIPLRLATGAFLLNSGLTKLGMPEEHASRLHGMATGAYPGLKRLDPKPFGQALAVGETSLGVALLTPFLPSSLVGLGLGAFSGALLGMYARTPALHQEGSLRPSEQGVAMAKDTWMAGIAAALVLDGISSSRTRRGRRRLEAKAAKAEGRLQSERVAKDAAKGKAQAARRRAGHDDHGGRHLAKDARHVAKDVRHVAGNAKHVKHVAEAGASVAKAAGKGYAVTGLGKAADLAGHVAGRD